MLHDRVGELAPEDLGKARRLLLVVCFLALLALAGVAATVETSGSIEDDLPVWRVPEALR